MIAAARARVEAFLDRKLITQTWHIYFDCFPASSRNVWWDGVRDISISELVSPKRAIDLPFGPMISLDAFATFDDVTPDPIPFDVANFQVDTSGPIGRIALKIGATWPATVLRGVNGIRVTGKFGYGEPNQVPNDIILALKMYVADMYEHRGDEEKRSMPSSAVTLLEPYRYLKAR